MEIKRRLISAARRRVNIGEARLSHWARAIAVSKTPEPAHGSKFAFAIQDGRSALWLPAERHSGVGHAGVGIAAGARRCGCSPLAPPSAGRFSALAGRREASDADKTHCDCRDRSRAWRHPIPGAVSPEGIYEKDIVLPTASVFARQLAATRRFRVVLTRSVDEFIPLRDRVARAQRWHADLFLSIHADALPDRETRGFSVFTLSTQASDREAAALAISENRADLVGGVNLSRQPRDVGKILMDLWRRQTRQFLDCPCPQLSSTNSRAKWCCSTARSAWPILPC